MGGALRDLEALGYLAGGETAVSLKQHEGGEEAVGLHWIGCPRFPTELFL